MVFKVWKTIQQLRKVLLAIDGSLVVGLVDSLRITKEIKPRMNIDLMIADSKRLRSD